MASECDLIARIELADVPMLVQLPQRLTRHEEELLQTHLSDHRFRSMRSLALQTMQRRATARTRGNIVVVHGTMGGSFHVRQPAGQAFTFGATCGESSGVSSAATA